MLPSYQTILVTTDLTPHSKLVFKHAVLLARQQDAKIHLLYVLPQLDASVRSYVSTVLGSNNLEELERSHQSEALQTIRKDLEEFAHSELEGNQDDLKRFAGVDIHQGSPAEKILAVAKEINADLILMGTHSKGFIEHSFLGSVAERVLHKSDRPVFVIPLPKR